jgi:zinc/manganese transport system permease protein
MLVGNLLFVSWPQVRETAILYAAIGAFHFIFRKQFLAISRGKEGDGGLSVRFWDLLFYASFGIVVTSSVSVAGVLLVFCYLIVPSVGGMIFAQTIGKRLVIGWTMGVLVSGLGMWGSLQFDLPTGPTIVCAFGLVLALMAILKALMGAHPAAAVSS